MQSSLGDDQDIFTHLSAMICVIRHSDATNEVEDCDPTYNHVVADVTECGLLEDVLHEAVSRRVYLQRVA